MRPAASAASAALLVALLSGAGCGGSHKPIAPGFHDRLRIGVTEANPALLWSAPARRVPAAFAPWRDALAAVRPAYYRLQVSWADVQPRPGAAPNWDVAKAGCERTLPPCAPYAGVREQLRAVRSAQLRSGGWQVVVDFLYTPAWAARRPGGCEPGAVARSSRQIAREALPAYRALVRSLLALGRSEGVSLRYWSAWNEPNYRGFVSPQRAGCAVGSPSVAPAYYGELVRQLRTALAGDRGPHEILLGEVSDAPAPTPKASSAVEFADGIPRDVVCASDVWAQHVYVGDPNTVAAVERALDARRCPRRHRIWITETGVGGPRPGGPRPLDPGGLRAQCRAIQGLLSVWSHDPRVQAAFQYSFREDDRFPVGLVDPRLTRAYPSYELWRAWGRDAGGGGDPPLPARCRG